MHYVPAVLKSWGWKVEEKCGPALKEAGSLIYGTGSNNSYLWGAEYHRRIGERSDFDPKGDLWIQAKKIRHHQKKKKKCTFVVQM